MPKLILVTVGTSALDKFRDAEKWKHLEDLCKTLNEEAANNESEEYERQKTHLIGELQAELSHFYDNGCRDFQSLTAELGSLMAMRQEQNIGEITNADQIVLLHSDTAEGKLCAEVTAKIVQSQISNRIICTQVSIEKIEGLQVDDPEKFKVEGLKNLYAKVKFFAKGSFDFYFNITGGFKGLIPYATSLAWDADHPMDIVYLFERSQRIILIKQPRSSQFSDLQTATYVGGHLP